MDIDAAGSLTYVTSTRPSPSPSETCMLATASPRMRWVRSTRLQNHQNKDVSVSSFLLRLQNILGGPLLEDHMPAIVDGADHWRKCSSMSDDCTPSADIFDCIFRPLNIALVRQTWLRWARAPVLLSLWSSLGYVWALDWEHGLPPFRQHLIWGQARMEISHLLGVHTAGFQRGRFDLWHVHISGCSSGPETLARGDRGTQSMGTRDFCIGRSLAT